MTQRVALVTGAMGGLGTAICQELAKAGHKVVAAYHPQFDNKDAWLADMAAAGFKDFVCVAGDVSVLEDCQKMVAEAEAACGQVDILINNAGITRDRMFAKMERDGWDAVIATNLTSLFNMTKQVSAKMAERGWGRIVNISSVNGVKGQAGQTNYSAAKAGVIGFTKTVALELAYLKGEKNLSEYAVDSVVPDAPVAPVAAPEKPVDKVKSKPVKKSRR